MMGNILSQPPVNVPTDGSYSGNVRARTQASNDNNWQKMLQAAAMASMMDNKTALGFGLGSLLFNAWDSWKNRDKKPASNGDGTISLTEIKEPIWNDPLMPPGYELTGTEITAGTAPIAPLTQQIGLSSFDDQTQKGMNNTVQPQNFNNFLQQTGTATNPWSMPKPSVADMQNNALGGMGIFDPNSEWYKKLNGGGK